MDMSIARNIALASLKTLRRLGFISGAAERRFARDWATRLQVKYGSLSSPMTSLSGGNQQKVVLAKWLGRRPAVLIVDEPTRGIDIGTKAEVHRLLEELAGEGVAILVISSELPEVLRLYEPLCAALGQAHLNSRAPAPERRRLKDMFLAWTTARRAH